MYEKSWANFKRRKYSSSTRTDLQQIVGAWLVEGGRKLAAYFSVRIIVRKLFGTQASSRSTAGVLVGSGVW